MSRQDVAALTVRLGEYNIKQSGETKISAVPIGVTAAREPPFLKIERCLLTIQQNTLLLF